MTGVHLDLKRLLGFKIVANGETALMLQGAKIGVKSCIVADDNSAPITSGASLVQQVELKIG